MRGKSNGKKTISLVNLDPNMLFAERAFPHVIMFLLRARICVGNERGKGGGGGKSGKICFFAENKTFLC